jgi:hypothetical protein
MKPPDKNSVETVGKTRAWYVVNISKMLQFGGNSADKCIFNQWLRLKREQALLRDYGVDEVLRPKMREERATDKNCAPIFSRARLARKRLL